MDWCDQYASGIKKIDDQHRQMAIQLNRFSLFCSTSTNSVGVTLLLNEILIYVAYHFFEEESLYTKMGLHNIKELKEEHRVLYKKMEEYRDKIFSGEMVLTYEVSKYFEDYFTNHLVENELKQMSLQE